MPDMEKVINGLECCSVPEGHCEKCPYETDGYIAECTSALARDALALLKEQEEAIPISWLESFTRLKCMDYVHGIVLDLIKTWKSVKRDDVLL